MAVLHILHGSPDISLLRVINKFFSEISCHTSLEGSIKDRQWE